MDHYQVKFVTPHGEMLYGIASYMDEEDKKAAPPGNLLIEDAIFPQSYWVPEERLVDITRGYPNEYDKFVDSEFEKARKVSDKVGDKIAPGNLFGIGVADGTAWYVVTKVSKNGKKCDVEWRGFCGDRWKDHYFGIGRKNVPVKDIAPYVRRANAKLFSLKRLA
jgi:hypothetical protein